MRRITMVVLVGALLVALVAGVAVAKTFQCDSVPCQGETDNADRITERQGSNADDIDGLKGADVINASEFGNDNDDIGGDQQSDRIRTDDGDSRDVVDCGAGRNDVAIVDELDAVNFSNCENVRGPGSMPPPVEAGAPVGNGLNEVVAAE